MTNAKFRVGAKVRAKGNSGKTANGTVTSILWWNSSDPSGYRGYVYEFKNGCGRTFFGYKEADLEKVPA